MRGEASGDGPGWRGGFGAGGGEPQEGSRLAGGVLGAEEMPREGPGVCGEGPGWREGGLGRSRRGGGGARGDVPIGGRGPGGGGGGPSRRSPAPPRTPRSAPPAASRPLPAARPGDVTAPALRQPPGVRAAPRALRAHASGGAPAADWMPEGTERDITVSATAARHWLGRGRDPRAYSTPHLFRPGPYRDPPGSGPPNQGPDRAPPALTSTPRALIEPPHPGPYRAPLALARPSQLYRDPLNTRPSPYRAPPHHGGFLALCVCIVEPQKGLGWERP